MINFKIDIVSDVVCPWCIVGYLKLSQAIEILKNDPTIDVSFDISWHPFELAPDLSVQGENLREFLAKKYGNSAAAGEQARNQLTDIGKQLGFDFNFAPEMQRYNTFKAHQLLFWAKSKALQTPLKLALFKSYFTDNLNITDNRVLSDIAANAGLDSSEALSVLENETFAQQARAHEQHWIQQGINSVPSVVLQEKYLIPGALESQAWVDTIKQVMNE